MMAIGEIVLAIEFSLDVAIIGLLIWVLWQVKEI